MQQVAGVYAQVWQAMEITPMARPASMAGLAAPDARVYVCPFHVTLGPLQAGFEVWLPHAMLEPLLPTWRQPVSDPPARRGLEWQQRLAQSLQTVSVQLQASLVGARGFEPPTPCSRSRCATRLRYTPSDRGHMVTAEPILAQSTVCPAVLGGPLRDPRFRRSSRTYRAGARTGNCHAPHGEFDRPS